MQVQKRKTLYVVLMHNISVLDTVCGIFCVDKICELQIIGSRVIYPFFSGELLLPNMLL